MSADPNFLKYMIKCKKNQMASASDRELLRLTAECNEALRMLAEGPDGLLIQKNSEWLRKPLIGG